MIAIGLAFLVTWLQVQIFAIDIVKAILVTGLLFVIAGILVGERAVFYKFRAPS